MTALSHCIFTGLQCRCSCPLAFTQPMRKQQYFYSYYMTASVALEIWFKLLSTTLICWTDYIIWQTGTHQRDTSSSMIHIFVAAFCYSTVTMERQICLVHSFSQHISSQHYVVRFCKQNKKKEQKRNKSSISG